MDYNDYRALQAHKRAIIKAAAHLLPHMPAVNWLCWGWKKDRNTGKPGKVPMFGSTSKNVESWLTLEQAVKRIGETDPYGNVLCVGVGYVVVEGIISLDLDDCIDAETGEIHPPIQAELDKLPKTFTYKTVSKTGLRVVGTDLCGVVTGGKRTCYFPSGHTIEIYVGPCTFFNTFSPTVLPGRDLPVADLGFQTLRYLTELANDKGVIGGAAAVHEYDGDGADLSDESGDLSSTTDILHALATIVNHPTMQYPDWNRIGGAIFNATGGSAEGLAAWDAWSKGHPKYAEGTCAGCWNTFKNTSPYDKLKTNFGSLVNMAREVDPTWRAPSWNANKDNEPRTEATDDFGFTESTTSADNDNPEAEGSSEKDTGTETPNGKKSKGKKTKYSEGSEPNTESAPYSEALQRAIDKAPHKPVVQLRTGEYPAAATAGERAIIRSTAQIFQRGQDIVRPCSEEVPAAHNRTTKTASLHALTSTAMADTLDQVAFWGRYDGRSKTIARVDAPKKVGDTILSRVGMWALPKLKGIITCPTIRLDGTLLSSPGYDAATHLYHEKDSSIRLTDTVYNPTRAHAEAALALLENLISGFPFTSEVGKAVALSAIVTALVRGTMGCAPLHVFRASTPGTGKSYLADVVSAIATGCECPVIGASSEKAESEKRLTSILLAGYPICSLDNVNGELGGDLLCQAIERPIVSLRIMGKTEVVKVESTTMMLATGNNLRVHGDMVRRAIIGDLDANMERPELRDFKFYPVSEVAENRGLYVSAALTIVRAYILEGRPKVLKPRIGSFEDWSDNVRSALVWLGCADPAISMEMARDDDPELEGIREVMDNWRLTLGTDEGFTSKDAIDTADEMVKSDNGILEGHKHPEWRECLLKIAGERGRIDVRLLGNWLRDNAGRIVEGHRFHKIGTNQRSAVWQLKKAKPAADNVVNISDYQNVA
ncbi:PriCT-2 domain-containing protein [Acidisoma sp. L85]|uniref:PriCT-2 domain-containing protein n=1 Tax=Acidisoma sp. L85 TaxID=1641850 RepID=UPI00131A7A1D|nr:PriCT-2 domain-containing protein [Acidisoma sp. L85]